MMGRTARSLLALALAVVLFAAVNVLVGNTLRGARIDLTADARHTLSPGTLTLVRGLAEPLALTLYLSDAGTEAVPALRLYGQRVRTLLEEISARADGRIRLAVVDPDPYSEAEDRAAAAGLRPLAPERGGGRPFHLGLVGTDGTDRQEVVPVFDPAREAFLEYDVVRLLNALAEPRKPVVGILTDMPLALGPGGLAEAMRSGARPYAVYQQLRTQFDVRLLPPTAAVEPGIDVLVVARPFGLSDDALFAIDQHVLNGGRTLLFVDPWAESDLDHGTNRAALLPALFAAWGLTMAPGRFVADPGLAIAAATGRGTVPYPAWLALGPDERDRGDAITAALGVVNVASAGSLGVRPGGGATLSPLLTSSPAGQLADVALVAARPDPERLMAALGPQGARQVIAGRVGGRLRTAFPERGGVKESTAPANLIVVADSDLLENRFWTDGVRPFAGNGDFVANAVETLAGGAALAGLRGRAGTARPFTRVEELRRAAGQQVLAHEEELRRRLDDAERRLAAIQAKAPLGTGALLPAEEQAEIDRFRAEAGRIRRELRAVRHTLDRDIERLEATVKAVNIAAVPLAVAVGALGLAGWRRHRRARRVRE